MHKKTPPGKTVNISIFPPYYTVYTVNLKAERNGSYPVHPSAVTIAGLQFSVIGKKLATCLVKKLHVDKIFISGFSPSLFDLYTQ